MQDNFNFKAWLQEHRSGPYSKDNADYGKRSINESVEEAMDLTPPSPENIYQSEPEEEGGDDYTQKVMDLAGPHVKEAIENLKDFGFDDEDIMSAFAMILQDYNERTSEMEEGENLSENDGGFQVGDKVSTMKKDTSMYRTGGGYVPVEYVITGISSVPSKDGGDIPVYKAKEVGGVTNKEDFFFADQIFKTKAV